MQVMLSLPIQAVHETKFYNEIINTTSSKVVVWGIHPCYKTEVWSREDHELIV